MEKTIKIEVEHVSKQFGSHVVLDDVSLSCESGNIYGIVGYNGSGKTVLFKCICGLLRADSGSITVGSQTIGEEMLQDAGIIIEHPAFLAGISAQRNLELLYMLNHKLDRKKIRQTLELVGLDPNSKKKVKDYSLGMRQRLAIAQAIMEEPKILILDEPMNGLDKKGIKEVRDMLMERKKQGCLILLASHNREDIQVLCDEVYEMEEGKLEKREEW
ncbi:multidrug ABC transporter ATP-binding protein [Clostridia bacterium]|nr:multidrug ABC transporter ATP-binding protein [Clostridia bacterium]